MALDGLRWTFDRRRFDYVGIECALNQPIDAACFLRDAMGFVVEDGDKFVADDLALGLRIGHSSQLREKACARVDSDQVKSKLLAEILLDFKELVLAEYPVVDEDAGQPVTNRTVNENSSD